MIDMTYARRAFDAYLDQFDRTDEKIRLKIVHTDGVVRYMTETLGISSRRKCR